MGKSKASLIKHAFFNSAQKDKQQLSFKESEFDIDQLKSELSTLYQLFLSNKQFFSQNPHILLYTAYLYDLLIRYYQCDYVRNELEKLQKQRKEIYAFINKHASAKVISYNFRQFILNQLKEEQAYVFSANKLRIRTGWLNTKRSQFNYSRSLAIQILLFLQKSFIAGFIEQLNVILGNHSGLTGNLNLLIEARETIALIGIVLYSTRFFINLILLLKHIILAAKSDELSFSKVLNQELEKRGFHMANDLAWLMVTLFTTYSKLFHITSSAIAPLILGFLIFDGLLLCIQWALEERKYKRQLNELILQKKEANPLEQQIIQRQIDILNDQREAQNAYFTINVVGAYLLAASFAITLTCSGPLALAGLALLSMVGNAFYNTSEQYKKYQQARIAIHREKENGKILSDAYHEQLVKQLDVECGQERLELIKTLAINVGGISFIITAAAVCWPVALSLTVLYAGYQLYQTYQGQNKIPPPFHDLYRLFSNKNTGEKEANFLSFQPEL